MVKNKVYGSQLIEDMILLRIFLLIFKASLTMTTRKRGGSLKVGLLTN